MLVKGLAQQRYRECRRFGKKSESARTRTRKVPLAITPYVFLQGLLDLQVALKKIDTRGQALRRDQHRSTPCQRSIVAGSRRIYVDEHHLAVDLYNMSPVCPSSAATCQAASLTKREKHS